MTYNSAVRRRDFFATAFAAALPAQQVPALAKPPAANGKLKITDVEIWRVEGRRPPPEVDHRQSFSRPAHIYDELHPRSRRPPPGSDGKPFPTSALYIKIRTDAGVDGFSGPVFSNVCSIVDQSLRPFLIGKDPLAGEALWDQMYRMQPHSQGQYMMALSAVDNVLWDLRGRYFGVPVYRLLGGPTRKSVEAYASCIDLSTKPGELPALARHYQQEGFRYEKWFLPYGPADGPEGLRKNIEMLRILRETLGEDGAFMLDAWMSWDLSYAIEFVQQAEKHRPRWLEEAFLPADMQSFVDLRKRSRIPIASGEHFYGRWTAGDYLRAGALDVLQTDPDWCGGITELLKICAIASQYNVQVIPHGDCLHPSLHVIAAQSPHTCPLLEYMVNRLHSGRWKYYFEKNPLLPERGRFALPERPGFGIELDEGRVEKRTRVRWSWS